MPPLDGGGRSSVESASFTLEKSTHDSDGLPSRSKGSHLTVFGVSRSRVVTNPSLAMGCRDISKSLDTHPCSAFRCLQKLVEGLKAEIEAAHLPIVHFTVDLWTCKVSGSKYLGIHIFWVDKAFAFRHALLSVSWSQSSVFASFSRVLFFQVLST